VVIASFFLVTSAATAAGSDLTAQALDARQAVGLPKIAENPAVEAAAGAVLAGGNPQGAFAANGGAGTLLTVSVPAGLALSNDKLKAIVFDPRLTAIAVLDQSGKVAVAAALDPSRSFSAPVLAGNLADPGVAGSIAILFPPGSGTIPKITLQRYRGKQLVRIGTVATAISGADGAILVALKGQDRIIGPQIGYGLTYTLKVGVGRSFTVKTIPIPKTLESRPFVAGPGFSGADKRAFLRYVGEMPPEGRKIVDIIKGAITVSVLGQTAALCGFQTSCAGLDPGRGYFLVVNRAQLHSSLGHFIVTHEMGHLVDFLGLDTFSHQAFLHVFDSSPGWKSCFPLRGACTPFIEVYADQFAFFSTNDHGIQSGYNDPRLATTAGFSQVLRTQWAFRPPQNTNPLAGFGPLAQSFSQAMHSSESAL
jgi:hypothetical protein